MVQLANPTFGASLGGWSEGAGDGDVDAWDELDEGFPSDDATTYWSSPTNADNDALRVGISPVTDPGVSTGHLVRVRCRNGAGGSRQVDLTIRLFDVSVQICEDTSNTDIGTAWTTFTYNLTGAEADAIVNYNNLRIEVEIDTPGGGSGSNLDCSTMQFECPDASSDKSGSATISGGGSIVSAANTSTRSGTASVAGGGAFAELGGRNAAGSAAVAGGGALAVVATPGRSSAPTISGGGDLASTAGAATRSGVAAISGGGLLTPAATGAHTGVAAIAGGGSLGEQGSGQRAGSPTLPGGGTIVATGTSSEGGAVELTYGYFGRPHVHAGLRVLPHMIEAAA